MTDASALISTSYSRYLARAAAARPALAEQIAAWAAAPLGRAQLDARLTALLATPAGTAAAGDEQLKRALRQLRAEAFGAVAERDLRGLADVAEVTGAMTDLAEVAVQRSLALLSAELEAQYGEPRGADGQRVVLGVVGMGKLGGRELNVSSDIDLIFVYEDDGETTGGARSPLSTQEYFTRLGRRLIGVLSEVTADGYVFRVDMRLRPNGDSGPLVCSVGMLEEYFYVQGREWERYAWIKGRLVSEGDSDAAQRLAAQLESIVKPFVYRRYLDFGVIGAIRSLHQQIRHEAARRASMRPDKADDIKLGRGGIREIEFSAQVFQLIRGGQDAGFRVRPTLAVLRHAQARGLIGDDVRARLADAYNFLRTLEHRLQYRNDAQTHAMPVEPDERAALAASLGFADYAALMTVLDGHRTFVEAQFDQIFADKANGGPCAAGDDTAAAWIWSGALADDGEDDALVARLDGLGFADPAAVLARLRAIWQSSRYTGLPEKSRQRFDSVAQRALDAAPKIDAARRDDTIVRLFDLLETVSRRGVYLALLTEYPAALDRVLSVLGATRWGGGYLIRHPQLLDELLDDEAIASPFDWPAFKDALRARLAAADGPEQQMDLLRHAQHAEVFRILLIDLAGQLSVEHVSDRLSELADAVLDVTIEVVWSQLAKRHRDVPKFAVIAYGKLGGKELGYASDLDLIFLYDDPDERSADVYTTFYTAPDHVAHDRDRRGRAVRHRPAAAAERRGRAARHRSRCVPPLSAARGRCGEHRVGVGAPGADARPLQRGRRADRRGFRGDPPAGADDAARRGRTREGDRRHARQGVRRPSEPHRAVRPEARPRRDGRHRVHRPVLGAAACVERRRADPQYRQHRAAARGRALRADGRGRGRARRRGVPHVPEAAAQAAARRDGEGARRSGRGGGRAGGRDGAVGARVRRRLTVV